MSIWYLTNDLMFSSRVVSVAERLGKPLEVLFSPADLQTKLTTQPLTPPTLVLIDLSLPALDLPAIVPALQKLQPAPHILAYGPHVHEARLAAAQAAGCQSVLTRGQFDRDVEAILQSV